MFAVVMWFYLLTARGAAFSVYLWFVPPGEILWHYSPLIGVSAYILLTRRWTPTSTKLLMAAGAVMFLRSLVPYSVIGGLIAITAPVCAAVILGLSTPGYRKLALGFLVFVGVALLIVLGICASMW